MFKYNNYAIVSVYICQSMECTIQDLDHSLGDIARLTGYEPADFEHGGDFGMIKRLGASGYPRFHLSVKTLNGGDYGHTFILWVEYSPGRRDRDYDGKIVKEELNRIKDILMKA